MSTEIITTEKMVFGGDCIAKIDGKTVFVPYSIPGEKLKVEITKDTRDYCEAQIVDILEPSPYRVKPLCPYYGLCGGCNMQHISADHQEKLRSMILRDAFLRAGITPPEIQVVSGPAFGYRSRFQLHDGGLMQKKSNNIIQIDSCPCATDEINEYLKTVPVSERPKGRCHIFGSDKAGGKVIVAREENTVPEQKPERSTKGKKNRKPVRRFTGTAPVPENTCTVNLCGKNISFDVKGFFQSNMYVLEKAIPLITGEIEGNSCLDMYAGCGTFSVFLSDRFNSLTLVEHNRDALVQAENNLSGHRHESYGLSGETWAKYHSETCVKNTGGYDAAVIDPPRSGMEKEVCKWLCSSSIPRINSLSCDIATHARDAGFLIKAGYEMESLYLLDFYPQTSHIESLAVFTKGLYG
ncbi:MAG: class I SAM-dependent RNA methyltransferase [Treponema sp.]|nr:class I SAM-dependent RNA methyltransferase [Treponema sp.]